MWWDYRIVPAKRPWALAAQAPKFQGGRLHGKRACLGLYFFREMWFIDRPYCIIYGSTIPTQESTPDVKLAAMGESTCIIGSSVIRRGQPDSGESCIVLQSGPTRSLVAKFPQRSVAACSMRISCCRGRTLRTRPRTGVANILRLMSWHPKCIVAMWAQQTYLRIHY